MQQIEIGNIVLIKNGQKIIRPLVSSQVNLIKIKMEINDPNFCFQEVQEGYNVIILLQPFNKLFTEIKIVDVSTIKLMIAPKLLQCDADMIQSIIKTEEINCQFYSILNYQQNYDYDFTTSIDQEQDLLTISDYFIREKLNQLSEKETEMFQKYRIFNLKEILVDNLQRKYPINHRNAGIIHITDSNIICRSLKRKSHEKDMLYILSQLYPNQSFQDLNINAIVRTTNDIMIRLDQNYIFIWLPEKINTYQKMQLILLHKQLMEYNILSQKLNGIELNIYFSVIEFSLDVNDNLSVKEYKSFHDFSFYINNGFQAFSGNNRKN